MTLFYITVKSGKMVYSIDEIKLIVIPIAEVYGIASISLFGSYAKGKATSDSDIDFMLLFGRFSRWNLKQFSRNIAYKP